ncbi:putative secreted protein with C-terminal beta-propeller domain [Methanolinea mesophila]|uniref:beta-propeller domain-containing protein n=1 Tax=Methanolinea mesophila TaxID=547055 RepID=UPI001AE30D5C|nr:beta-propeller domain-containing protein [Methanolinea mesophila]MBP1929468.1 putative secreted protein with C-terminal beta-propeller domain [Methanolinea mesophila]
MIGRKESLILVSGVAIGIVIAIGLLAFVQVLSPGTGTLPLPDLTGNGDTLPLTQGIGQLPSAEDVRNFILSHTETETQSGQEMVPMTVQETSPVPLGEGVRTWRYELDTATFKPDEYIVTVSGIQVSTSASALFNLLAGPSGGVVTQQVIHVPVSQRGGSDKLFISIDPIGDHYVGEKFAITGTTNLPAGEDEILVEVVSSSFAPTQKTQSGEFSGSTGTIHASTGGAGAFYTPGGYWQTPVPTPAMTLVPTTSADREYSTTNVQVKEVDEADIVKTDGTYIYVVSGNELNIVRAYPAESAGIISTTGFSGTPVSLYLYGDKVALICRDYRPPEYWRCEPGRCTWPAGNGEKTVIYIFSVKDRAMPTLEREVEIDGGYTDSRMIGQWLYFLTSTPVNPHSDDITFPAVRDGVAGTFTPVAYSLEGTDKAFAFTTIGSVGLDTDAPVRAKTFLVGTAGTVYVSPTTLYFGVHSMGEPSPLRHVDAQGREVGGTTDQTAIYSFSLQDGAIRFNAAGKVDGTLLNQYAMDEYKGNLRLGTTVTEYGYTGRSTLSSTVSVLDTRLNTIGMVAGIAPGERIYATRFMGDRLYLVTFMQTDPFFVVDLSDPAHPALAGELKLPGFSNYLHPYDATHIIGVGKTANFGAVKLSLFDVSDISRPGLVDSVELGEAGSSSEVLNDPKAFLFDKEKDILVLPVELAGLYRTQPAGGNYYGTRDVWGGAYVFSVDPDRGFSLKGTVKHYDEHSGDQVQVKRALYIEDTLYTISPRVIYMSDLANGVSYLNNVRLG